MYDSGMIELGMTFNSYTAPNKSIFGRSKGIFTTQHLRIVAQENTENFIAHLNFIIYSFKGHMIRAKDFKSVGQIYNAYFT